MLQPRPAAGCADSCQKPKDAVLAAGSVIILLFLMASRGPCIDEDAFVVRNVAIKVVAGAAFLEVVFWAVCVHSGECSLVFH